MIKAQDSRLKISVKSYLSHLECTACGTRYSADKLYNTCPACGKVLFARYDLTAARRNFSRDDLARRQWTAGHTRTGNGGTAGGQWRWFELLPIRDPNNIVTLGEGSTPLLHARRLGRLHGFDELYVKEEGLNPTGSFKARGLSAAVSRAKELGVSSVAVPSAGNAAGALAAYGAAAGMQVYVFMPQDAPEINKLESAITGAHVYLVNGLINDAGRIVRTLAPTRGWFDVSTCKEPYRVEGKKTMGLELAEQFEWELPDAIIYPTGGGTGIIGMWKAFAELEELGWIGSKRPKMISVQATECAPIVRAFDKGAEFADPWQNARTVADGLRVPGPFADYLILRAIRESGGTAIAVSDNEIRAAMSDLAQTEGLFVAPEGAATYAGFQQLAANGFLEPSDRVVLFNTGTGIKYPQLVQARFPVLEPTDPRLVDLVA